MPVNAGLTLDTRSHQIFTFYNGYKRQREREIVFRTRGEKEIRSVTGMVDS